MGYLSSLGEYGDVVRLRFGKLAVYVVTDPDATRDVLVPGDLEYKRGICFEKLEPGLGKGIATASGDEHKRGGRRDRHVLA
ncbi:hypothetical protein [Kibdelosporangium philippinense]|uniref:hypothetical protein n=1 Tax=Kibdelosporangium philippinense TaxID=211113 RepID=UPI0024C4369E|nr:hypothetical protein [Kibdelosporangium philippinense]